MSYKRYIQTQKLEGLKGTTIKECYVKYQKVGSLCGNTCTMYILYIRKPKQIS